MEAHEHVPEPEPEPEPLLRFSSEVRRWHNRTLLLFASGVCVTVGGLGLVVAMWLLSRS
jgi:hypothetical protein